MDAISSLMLQEGWRKGPWTALEDRLLTEYVQQHGEGSWNSVAKLTGTVYTVNLCGKI
jgi:transcription factor MYB, plant